ncbi:hypothetical protein J8F10_03850 [Gemmata sp. G18]|uniref:Carboxypeptidase regulatory-like domain-containing protein n=1 Tax=Gemmata palustris TaxID=2822762 RepID=A0ABS5BL50_9BACT|nr:hypothetical protein [Gemmata palustris]MBP3954423.1 hypothetical protein [Gemmata palustris]
MTRTLGAVGAALTCAAVVCGCGPGEPPRVAVYPVRGELFVGGKPAAGAVIVFHPTGDPAAPRPRATVAADGAFRPQFRDDTEGIPAGEYVLTVTWREAPIGMSPDRLKGKHADPARPVARVTVGPGESVIPAIRLK